MSRFAYLLLIVLSVLLMSTQIVFNTVDAQAPTRFAYHVVGDVREGGWVAFVDPASPDRPMRFVEVPVEAEWAAPSRWLLSPNAEWMAFATSADGEDGRTARFVRLFNLITSEVRDLPSGYLLDWQWSPQGGQLAIAQGDVIIHDVATDMTTNLTNDDVPRVNIAWSSDGSRIASLIDYCPNECIRYLETIDVETGGRDISPSLIDLALMLSPVSGVNCNLDWSPDGRFTSFILGCPQSQAVEVAREVFLWDVENKEFIQITNFTTAAFAPSGIGISTGEYRTLWLDPNLLLISASETPSVVGATFLYKVDEARLVQVLDDYVDEWALNSARSQLAASSFQANTLRLFSLDAASVQLEDVLIEAQTNLPFGCNLFWSSDADVLAYIHANCPERDTFELIFIEPDIGAFTQFIPLLPDGSTPTYMMPIGWVQR